MFLGGATTQKHTHLPLAEQLRSENFLLVLIMSGKILCRCDICGQIHAAYLVPAEDDQAHNYCYDCWKARFNASAPHPADKDLSPDSLDLEKDSL